MGEKIKTLAIVTGDPENDPSIKVFRFLQKELNYKLLVIDPLKRYRVAEAKGADILYHRISGRSKKIVTAKYDYYLRLIRDTKLPHIGDYHSLKKIKSKFYQYKAALESGLNAPKTIFMSKIEKIDDYIARIGGFPMVVKKNYSLGGKDVHLVNDRQKLKYLLSKAYEGGLIAQHFVELKRVRDYRVYVIGDNVCGGIIRESRKEGEFRANTNLGGTAKYFEPSDKLKEEALKYAKTIKSEIIAVDFMYKGGKYIFVESNDAFSIKTDNEPKKIRVARAIVEYCLSRAK